MRKLLLLIVFIIAAVYAYHWYSEKNAPAPVVATPAPVIRRATPTPKRHAIEPSSLQTRPLGGGGGTVTPGPKANPLNAPHR
jgi:hypothetical protein